MPQYPGFYWSTMGSISTLVKTGIRFYPGFWNHDKLFVCAEHNYDTIVFVTSSLLAVGNLWCIHGGAAETRKK